MKPKDPTSISPVLKIGYFSFAMSSTNAATEVIRLLAEYGTLVEPKYESGHGAFYREKQEELELSLSLNQKIHPSEEDQAKQDAAQAAHMGRLEEELTEYRNQQGA